MTDSKLPYRLRTARFLSRWEPFALEFLLMVLAAWLAFAMLDDRITEATNQMLFRTVATLDLDTEKLGLMALMASVLQAAGLFVCLVDKGSVSGTYLRVGGLALSAFLWSAIGLTLWILNPFSISCVPLIAWGFSAAWALLRYPAIPGRTP